LPASRSATASICFQSIGFFFRADLADFSISFSSFGSFFARESAAIDQARVASRSRAVDAACAYAFTTEA